MFKFLNDNIFGGISLFQHYNSCCSFNILCLKWYNYGYTIYLWGSCYSIFSFMCNCFVDHCLSLYTFSFGHYVVCPSSIYGFRLPLWYLQTLLRSLDQRPCQLLFPSSVNYSHFTLLQKYSNKLNQTWQGWCLRRADSNFHSPWGRDIGGHKRVKFS